MNHSNTSRQSLKVASSAWPEVEHALTHKAIAILPIGAACKQHGHHLPMNTDFIQAEYLAARIMDVAYVAVWPTLGYGHYPAFIEYPGSISLSEQTFANTVMEIGNSILSFGAARLVILNTGISTIRPIEKAIPCMLDPSKVSLFTVYSGAEYTRVAERVERQEHGSHADELETSIMLVIEPQSVVMEKAQATTFEMARGPLNRLNSSQSNYSPSGVYGNARLATREKGEALITAILADLHEGLRGLV